MVLGLRDLLLVLQHPWGRRVLEGRGIEGSEWGTGPGPTSLLVVLVAGKMKGPTDHQPPRVPLLFLLTCVPCVLATS